MRSIILILIGLFNLNVNGVMSSESERRLISHLFDTYDRRLRPVKVNSESVNVTMNIKIFQLIAVNERQQSIEMSIWVRQSWNDPGLSWNETDFGDIKELHVNPENIWLPDIVLYNNLHDDNSQYGGNMDTMKTRVIIYPTGAIFWLTPVILKAG